MFALLSNISAVSETSTFAIVFSMFKFQEALP